MTSAAADIAAADIAATDTTPKLGRPKGKAGSPDTSSPLLAGYMTVPAFAVAVGKTHKTIERWMHTGILPYVRIGTTRLINIDQARAALEKMTHGSLAPSHKRAKNRAR